MSSEERKKILQMVEEGKISAEEAASLMRALEEDDAEGKIEVIEAGSGSGFESDALGEPRRVDAPEFDEIKARARRFALIPLWSGVFVTILSAWIIYSIQQNAGTNFWFYCMTLPLLFGVLLITLSSGGRSARWMYVNVDQKDVQPGDGPRHITLGFPIPFGLVFWLFETFGHNIEGMDKSKVSGIVQILQAAKDSSEPLMVNVDDDEASVQVFIG